jgi:8-oxo-dGTP pyrophosphatase MutT (NUDIX family)
MRKEDEEEKINGLIDDFSSFRIRKTCKECFSTEHKFKFCPLFVDFKNNVSNSNYIVNNYDEILERDILGFCAAGIFIVKHIDNEPHFLALNEKRHNKLLYNIIGGKRENLKESPINVAMREFKEETNLEISMDEKIMKYVWFFKSKYIALVYNLENFNVSNAILEKSVNSLDWKSFKDLDEKIFHFFSKEMINYIFENISFEKK